MIEISNLTKQKISTRQFLKIGEKVLAAQKRENFWFSLTFVGAVKMRALNRKHRGQDKPTDVLSFEIKGQDKYSDSSKFLGDIIICPNQVRINAPNNNRTYGQELDLVFIHGILHLLGYDHEKDEKRAKQMERLQEKYLQDFHSS